MRKIQFLVSIVCVAGLAAAASAQVANGDFSTGIGGWTPTTSGPSVSWHPSAGNPGGAAYFYHNGGGNAALSQSFTCGAAHGGGDCDITLDYRYFVTGGAQVQVIIELDGIVGYTATHIAEDAAWHTIPLTVPCGDHILAFQVNTVALPFLGQWHVFMDNVAGECTLPVADEGREWGSLKAIFR